MTPPDFELVARLQKDDVKAFDVIYSRYSANLYRFAFKFLRSEEEAKELVQSVFMKIWENRVTIKTDTSFKSFLFTIAYNDMCKLYRKRKCNRQFIKESIYKNKYSSTSETEELLNSRSLSNHIEEIIDRLPERQKSIFIKSRYEGKTTKEIAEECSLSTGTIDNYISQSLKFIRSMLLKESQ